MINFNKAFFTENSSKYIEDVLYGGRPAGDGRYTKLCHEWLEKEIPVGKALLVHSGTAALEMQMLLCGLEPGDEVIMPSFTFVSTANAVVLRGATPVFVDIRPDTLNINEELVESAVTNRTKAIAPVHYAGVGCEMDSICRVAKEYGLYVLEDAAQGFGAKYKGRPLGTIGELGAISFHETKNIMSGEGGALFINNEDLFERAEILREKGTNRSRYFRGQVDKYTWVDIGSSYLPSDLIAAYLYSGLEVSARVALRRKELWSRYYDAFAVYEEMGFLRRPIVPDCCEHNAHIFYFIMEDIQSRSDYISFMKDAGVLCVFHYIPLHSSPAGVRFGRYSGQLDITDTMSERLVRLPLYYGMDDEVQDCVIEATTRFFKSYKCV